MVKTRRDSMQKLKREHSYFTNFGNFRVDHIKVNHSYIDSISYYHFKNNGVFHLIPEGCFELIFQINGTSFQKFFDDDTWNERPDIFIGGLHNLSYLVKPSKDLRCIGVKFKPNAAYAITHSNLDQFKNQIVNHNLILKSELNTLRKSITKNTSLFGIYKLIDVLLKNEINTQKTDISDKVNTHQIVEKNGRVSITNLATQANLSDSHFRKKFREKIGLSPRDYAKIIRINRAIKHLQTNYTNSLTEIALDLGYFDQSHFISEFKSVVKMTPSNYMQNVSASF